MKKSRALPVPPSPAESVASSETSETPSISDEASAISNNSIQAKRASSKSTTAPVQQQPPITRDATDGNNNNKERPPWRPVSIAVPSKANKNAILKAKILDATRRAILLHKVANASTQTDKEVVAEVHTKMMRDIGVGDSLRLSDKSIGTDDFTRVHVQPNEGKFLLTQSVGQMTDATLQWTASTQTAMPRIIASSNWTDLLGGPIRPEENHHNHMMKHEDVIDPTFAVWENLWEQPADQSTRVEWANREYDIEKRLRGMHLYPIPRQQSVYTRPSNVQYHHNNHHRRQQHHQQCPSSSSSAAVPDWIVGDLLYEADALLKSFQRASMIARRGPKMTAPVHNNLFTSSDQMAGKEEEGFRLKRSSSSAAALRPIKWDAVLQEACEQLAEKLNALN